LTIYGAVPPFMVRSISAHGSSAGSKETVILLEATGLGWMQLVSALDKRVSNATRDGPTLSILRYTCGYGLLTRSYHSSRVSPRIVKGNIKRSPLKDSKAGQSIGRFMMKGSERLTI
jgi:hypothetical protein